MGRVAEYLMSGSCLSVRRFAVCALAVLCATSLRPGIAQETRPVNPNVADDLQATLRELRELRQSYYAGKELRAAEIVATQSTVRNLRSDVERLEADVARLDEDSTSIRAELDELHRRNAALEQETSRVLAAISSFGDTVRPQVTHGLPYRQSERLRAIAGFRDETSVASAFALMWTFVEDEIRVARSGETYSDEIELDGGRIKHARFVRVGKHVLGFVTEDGVDVGIWMVGIGWVTDPARFDPEAVRTAVEILDRRRGPEHVSLPIRLEGAGR